MTIRLDMLQRAGLAKNYLDESSGRIKDFVLTRFNRDGGFRGRSPDSDLYYTVFAMETLIALGEEVPVGGVTKYLQSWKDGESLDVVHLACLGRCWANLPGATPAPGVCEGILGRIETCRRAEGGYAGGPGEEAATIYSSFLALGAYQDLDGEVPEAGSLADWVAAQEPDSTPVMAATVVLLKFLGREIPGSFPGWLKARRDEDGGFLVSPMAPISDLLSTATALFALYEAGVADDSMRESCLDYVKNLWDDRGGFRSMLVDESLDCEYTYYGLLALGCLG